MEKLNQLLSEYKSIESAKLHLEKLQSELSNKEAELAKLGVLVDKEYNDVRRLEGWSLASLKAKVLGSGSTRYEIEKQEYLTAALAYKDLEKIVEMLRFECDSLIAQVKRETTVLKELELLVFEKEHWIGMHFPQIKSSLAVMTTQLNEQMDVKRMIYAANIELSRVNMEVEKLKTSLQKALNVDFERLRLYKEYGGYSENKGVRSGCDRLIQQLNFELKNVQQIAVKLPALIERLNQQLVSMPMFRDHPKSVNANIAKKCKLEQCDTYVDWYKAESDIGAAFRNADYLKGEVEQVKEALKAQQRQVEYKEKYINEQKIALVRELGAK